MFVNSAREEWAPRDRHRATMHAARGLSSNRKKLHTEANAIDSSRGPGFGFCRLYSLGIGFPALLSGIGRKRFANRLEHRLKMSRVKQSLAFTTEIDGST